MQPKSHLLKSQKKNTQTQSNTHNPDLLDIESYSSLYTGRTKITRLLFIADCCDVVSMQLEALRMAFEEVKKGDNTQLFREVVSKIDGRLGDGYGPDPDWSEVVERKAEARKDKLENELNAYRHAVLIGSAQKYVGGEELTMNRKDEVPKKDSKPQVVKLDKAFNLAEQWVKNMSKSSEDQSSKVLLKARPPRLGLGAAVPRQTPVAPSSDPVERKLRGNLDAAKRKAAKDALESLPSARDESVDEDSEEELESRSKAISKRPATNFNSSLKARKRQK